MGAAPGGGASSWYTANEVRLGFSECFSAVKRKGTRHGRRRGAVRVEKRLLSVQQISADIRIAYRFWRGWEGKGTAAKCPLRAGERAQASACLAWAEHWWSKGVEGARRASRRHKKATGSRGPGQTGGATLRGVEEEEHSTE